MLLPFYTARRNESTDLLKDFQNYQDRYEIIKDQIQQKRKQYENHTEILDQALQDIESEENLVAPNTQYRDRASGKVRWCDSALLTNFRTISHYLSFSALSRTFNEKLQVSVYNISNHKRICL